MLERTSGTGSASIWTPNSGLTRSHEVSSHSGFAHDAKAMASWKRTPAWLQRLRLWTGRLAGHLLQKGVAEAARPSHIQGHLVLRVPGLDVGPAVKQGRHGSVAVGHGRHMKGVQPSSSVARTDAPA